MLDIGEFRVGKIVVELILVVLLFGCTSGLFYGDELAGNWKTSAFGFEQMLYFDGQGVGQMTSSFGVQAFEYEILSDSEVKITNLVTGDVGTMSYSKPSSNILIFNKVSYSRVN